MLMSRITDINSRGALHNVESSWRRELTESIGNFAAKAQQSRQHTPRS
jgi:hypothetical protein